MPNRADGLRFAFAPAGLRNSALRSCWLPGPLSLRDDVFEQQRLEPLERLPDGGEVVLEVVRSSPASGGPKLMNTFGRSLSRSSVPWAPGKALNVQSPSSSQACTKSLSRPGVTVQVPWVHTSCTTPFCTASRARGRSGRRRSRAQRSCRYRVAARLSARDVITDGGDGIGRVVGARRFYDAISGDRRVSATALECPEL
jgi:hypothetical protein